jgi:fibronectin type 3 domain-containing protein
VVGGVVGAFLQVGMAPANAANGATSWTDNSVADGSVYAYRVYEQNAVTVSAPTNVAQVTTAVAAPNGLTLAATVTPAGVTLAWNDNSLTETSYQVLRDGVPIATLPANSTGYVDSTVVDGASYSYVVTASNATGSASSAPQSVAIALAAPSGLGVAATSNAPLTVTVSWLDNSSSETGYTVQRATNATFTTGLVTIPVAANATSVSDTTVVLGRTYYYRVQTVKGAMVSAWTPTSTIVVAVPATPTGLTATMPPLGTTPPTVTLRWTDVATTETGYLVLRATDSLMTQNLVTTTLPANTTNFVDTTVVPGATTYNYRVYATNAVGSSGGSNRVTARPGQLWPAAALTSAVDTTTPLVTGTGRRTVTLNWTNAVDGNGAPAVTALAVERSTSPAMTNPTRVTVATTAETAAMTGLNRNTTYYFRIRTTNVSGQNYSTVVSVTTQP